MAFGLGKCHCVSLEWRDHGIMKEFATAGTTLNAPGRPRGKQRVRRAAPLPPAYSSSSISPGRNVRDHKGDVQTNLLSLYVKYVLNRSDSLQCHHTILPSALARSTELASSLNSVFPTDLSLIFSATRVSFFFFHFEVSLHPQEVAKLEHRVPCALHSAFPMITFP